MFDALKGRLAAATSKARDAAGRQDQTTPWEWRDATHGVYVGASGEVWLYRTVPVAPTELEDPGTRLSRGAPLQALLTALGQTSTTPLGAIRSFSNNREVHIVSVTWEKMPDVVAETPEHRGYLEAALTFTVPHRAVFVGVKLRRSAGAGDAATLKGMAEGAFTKALGEAAPSDLSAWRGDIESVDTIMRRHNATLPTEEEFAQLESWFNHGQGPDTTVYEFDSHMTVGNRQLQIDVVRQFGRSMLSAPDAMWIADAKSSVDRPVAISVRAELEPAAVTRSRSRRAQRLIKSQIEEEQKTGDLERVENSETFHLAQQVEDYFANSEEALLTNCSILLAAPVSTADRTWRDEIRDRYGVVTVPLHQRQLPALDEMLPCSTKRINPHLQDVNIAMLAFSGLTSFSNCGDPQGMYMGLVDPDGTLAFLDTQAASELGVPPAMLVAGEPGSGKTFFLQSLATQAALSGRSVVFLQPKAADSLAPTAELVGGSRIGLSDLTAAPGALDPFAFADPAEAAEIAATHILSTIRFNDDRKEIAVTKGLQQAAADGVRCVGQALAYIADPEVVALIQDQRYDPLFNLAISDTPQTLGSFDNTLTLIEFDKALNLPPENKPYAAYERPERIAVNTVRLITRASMYMLLRSGRGGVLIVDEAWAFLKLPEAQGDLEKIAREGRSQGLLTVLATQKVADVLEGGVDLRTYLSRVLCLRTRDPHEARTMLELLDLEATPERIQWLRDCGPSDGTDGRRPQWAHGLFRDIRDRHAVLLLGPTPAAAAKAFSTKPSDREARRASRPPSGGPSPAA